METAIDGVRAELTGTVNGLVEFMSVYTNHYDYEDGSQGDALNEERLYLIQEVDKAFEEPVRQLGFFD